MPAQRQRVRRSGRGAHRERKLFERLKHQASGIISWPYRRIMLKRNSSMWRYRAAALISSCEILWRPARVESAVGSGNR